MDWGGSRARSGNAHADTAGARNTAATVHVGTGRANNSGGGTSGVRGIREST